VSLGLSIAACGDSDSSAPQSSNHAAPSNTTSPTLQDLRACVDAHPGDRVKAALTEGKPAKTKLSSAELDAYVPDDVLNRALAAGGYMRMRYDRKDSSNPIQVGAMDVLALGTADAAKTGAEATLRGTDSKGGSISKNYNVVQVETLLVVYPKRYRDDRGGDIASRGVRASAQKCLAKLGSTVKLPEPKRVTGTAVQ